MLRIHKTIVLFPLLLHFASPVCIAVESNETRSAEPGSLTFIQGNPSIRTSREQNGRITKLEQGDRVATREGDYVEIALTAGNYLRIGGNSKLKVVDTKFEQTQFEVVEGSVIVDSPKFDEKKHGLKLKTSAGDIKLLSPGLVRLKITPSQQVEVLVYNGVVEWVKSQETPISLKPGLRYNLKIVEEGIPQKHKLDKSNLDEMDRWSDTRSEVLSGKDQSFLAYQKGQSVALPRRTGTSTGGGGLVHQANAEAAERPSGEIRFRFFDQDKKPMQNIESRLVNLKTNQVIGGPKDKKGEVRFENLPEGSYQVYAQKKGYITAKSQVVEVSDRAFEGSLIIPREELLHKMEEEGRVAFEAQDYPKALEKYQAALELVPWEIPMRQNVMLSLVRLNQPDKARDIARQALVYEPGEFPKKEKEIMSTVSFEEGKLYLEQQKFDRAVASFTEALQGDPGNGQIYYGLALTYGHQGKYPEALRHIDEAIKLSPGEASYVEAKNMLLSNAKVAGKK